jgi:hypothetical protein
MKTAVIALAFLLTACASRPPAPVSAPAPEPQPSDEVLQLVSPIALFPDVLVAQVLAASTHPAELRQSHRWFAAYRGRSVEDIAQAIDGQAWDPDIKALTVLSPMLDALTGNFAWTVALGKAYGEDPGQVLAAVQALRRQAQASGELSRTSEQILIVEGRTILIEPAHPHLVYVPGGGIFDISGFERFSWGWHGWQVNWKQGVVMYQDAPYRSLQTGLRP